VCSDASPSRRRSGAPGGSGDGAARRAASAVSRTPSRAPRRPAEIAADNVLQIGHARNADVERLEPSGRLEQQGWGVSATVDRELDLTAQQFYLGALELVQRSGLCDGDQSECRVECAGLVLGLGSGERSARPSRRLRRERDRAVQKRRRCRQPPARLCAARRAFELGGDVFIEPRRRLREVPGTSVRIDLRVGGVGQRTMRGVPVLRRGRAIDGRADQRVTKGHPRADREQAVGVGRRLNLDPEPPGRPPHEHRVAHRLGRRDQQQLLGIRRQRREPAAKAVLNPPR
jgi:hypothetical protein